MGIKILRQSEPGQRLESVAAPALDDAAKAERERIARAVHVCHSRFGRGRKRVRRGVLRRMKPGSRKRKFTFGAHLLRETGHAEGGHHAWYYHATKGWRRRGTAAQRWMLGNTLSNWMWLRLELIEATESREKNRINDAFAAFKRTLELP